MHPFRERLVAPPAWWIGAAGFAVVCAWLMYVATTPTLAVITGLVAAVAAGLLVWSYGSVSIQVTPAGLRAGRAHLDAAHIGRAQALGPAQLRERLGPRADARAWLLTRPYLDRGVLVEVDDPEDPTPYWLVSSRRPEAVVAALGGSAMADADHELVQEEPDGHEEDDPA